MAHTQQDAEPLADQGVAAGDPLSRSIHLGGLPQNATREQVIDLFSATKCGVPLRCTLPVDRATGSSRGFAFVEFSTREATAAALSGRWELEKRALKVTAKKPALVHDTFSGRVASSRR